MFVSFISIILHTTKLYWFIPRTIWKLQKVQFSKILLKNSNWFLFSPLLGGYLYTYMRIIQVKMAKSFCDLFRIYIDYRSVSLIFDIVVLHSCLPTYAFDLQMCRWVYLPKLMDVTDRKPESVCSVWQRSCHRKLLLPLLLHNRWMQSGPVAWPNNILRTTLKLNL